MKKFVILFIISSFFTYPVIANNKTYNIDKKYVALTFDDGPSNYTDDIVNLLYENNCSATFFVLGNKVLHYQETLIDLIAKGNEIANHTYNHPWLTNLTNNQVMDEINSTQQIVNEVTGYTPTLFRPSYGDINSKLRKMINLSIILWTNDSNDWKLRSSKSIASNVIRHIKENDIILMHDTHKRSYEALKIIIPKLTEMGYVIVTVSELMEIKDLRELYNY